MPGNIVFLFSDEHNPFVSSVFGHPFVDTPNMQALADQGTVFENTYCPSPLCLPCRASFTSGKYVHRVQAYNNCTVNLPKGHPSWGSVLAEQGVHSCFAGKLDACDQAVNLGFSELIRPGDRAYPGDRNHQRHPLTIREGAAGRASRYGPDPFPFPNDQQVMDDSIDWLEGKARGLDRPWILAINLLAPHFPHYTTPELWSKYRDHGDLPSLGVDQPPACHPRARELRQHFETANFPEEHVRGLRRGYYGCVEWVDQHLGRLRRTLDTLGLSDSTNLIYSSDHGEMLGKFGMWWKCSLYEDSVRVPLIVQGPDFPSGERVITPVGLLDLQATFFDIVEAERPADWDGESLLKIENDDPGRTVFSEYHGHGNSRSSLMIRQGNWKLIYHLDAPHQLFDLEGDSNELNNLSPTHPNLVRRLEAELRKVCSPEDEDARAERFIQAQLDVLAGS